MSKTAPKKTKKPTWNDEVNARLRTLEEDSVKHAELIAQHRRQARKSFDNTAQQFTNLLARLTTLESRSAPAEEWVPKAGCHIILTEDQDISLKKGEVCEVLSVGNIDAHVQSLCPTVGNGRWWVAFDRIRPATPAEIASHKAKEEQRAKEVEWARYDVLQSGDACDTHAGEQAELFKLFGRPCTPGGGTRTWYYRTGVREDLCTLSLAPGEEEGSDVKAWLPFAEFLRRLQGTIAKRLEEERAKDLAKKLEFGTRVKCHDKEWSVACYGPDPRHGNRYMLVRRDDKDGDISTWPTRDQFTVLD